MRGTGNIVLRISELVTTDFAPMVDVEVITSVHHTLRLSEIENRLRGLVEQRDRAA